MFPKAGDAPGTQLVSVLGSLSLVLCPSPVGLPQKSIVFESKSGRSAMLASYVVCCLLLVCLFVCLFV